MAELKEGSPAPDFTMKTDGGGEVTLSDFEGQKVLLYFYPKDDTPGCTVQACALRDNIRDMQKLGVQIIGVSRDAPESHDKFKTKYNLNFPLASDIDGKVCEAYGVWVEKNMYGKKSMGIERASFLIDEEGKIAKLWRKVKPEEHVDNIKKALSDLSKAA